jgi:hypothetical protein
MIKIDIRADVKALQKNLTALAQTQLPFATAQALTAMAKIGQASGKSIIACAFPSATPFTRNSVGFTPARKNNPVATVFVKDIAASYLEPYEFGGSHKLPKSKVGGTLLNPKDIKTNQYGNISKGTLARLTGRADIFVGAIKTKRGATINGIWQRPMVAAQAKGMGKNGGTLRGINKGGSLKLLVRFGDALPVQQHLGFRAGVSKAILAAFHAEMSKALAAAIKTAR